jgi:hypothetical protein
MIVLLKKGIRIADFYLSFMNVKKESPYMPVHIDHHGFLYVCERNAAGLTRIRNSPQEE